MKGGRVSLEIKTWSSPDVDIHHWVKRTCAGIVERCAAATWDESVLRLQRYFAWEYEDYDGT